MLNSSENFRPREAAPVGALLVRAADQPLNSIAATIDGTRLHIQACVLDLKGIEKLRKHLDACAALLRFNAEEDHQESGSHPDHDLGPPSQERSLT